MNAIFPPAPSPEVYSTLGDLLYGDETRTHTAEAEWLALIHAIASGDTTAFGTLYMWTHGIVFTSILRITGNRSTAEELTIEVFHELWRTAADYDAANAPVVGWIMNLARSRAIEHQRPDSDAAPAAMREAVYKLGTGERTAIESALFGGSTRKDVARRTRERTPAVKARIRSALIKLRKMLAPKALQS